jgi:flagellar M-ring protein FliF
MLEPVVGRDNLRATVTADVDFSQVESTAESSAQPGRRSRPPCAASRSPKSPARPAQRPVRRAGRGQQPAAGAGHRADQRRAAAAAGPAGRHRGRRQPPRAVTNYEVDKTVRVTRNATGTVKRLNAAVVVNHRSSTDAQGQDQTVTTAAGRDREADRAGAGGIGFSKDRGDSVRVINAPFKVEPVGQAEAVPLWQQPGCRTCCAPAWRLGRPGAGGADRGVRR